MKEDPSDLAEQLNAAQRPHVFRDPGRGQRLRNPEGAADGWVSTCGTCGDYEDDPIHGGAG